MKYLTRIIAFTLLLSVVTHTTPRPLSGKSIFIPRSQSVNAARELVGWEEHINKVDECDFYGSFNTTFAYTHSYKERRIAEALFGNHILNFSGSLVTSRDANDILADYFGLSPAFQSTVELKPQIQNVVIDFAFYVGLDYFLPGLYFRTHVPVVNTIWDFVLDETIQNNGSGTAFPALYMATPAVTAPLNSVKSALITGATYGHVSQALQFGKVKEHAKLTKISEIQAALGYNFIRGPRGHFGINLRTAFPTGNRPKGEFIFEPMVGNGHAWELGIGITGHKRVWKKDFDQEINIYVDMNVTHLFKTEQVRSFDFKNNGFGSRYMLLKTFNATPAYTGVTLPAINQTTLKCDVKTDVQIDLVIKAGYTDSCWVADFGYNFWARGKEKVVEIKEDFPAATFGFKGIQNVAGTPNATESSATLNGNLLANQATVVDATSPVLILASELDPESAEQTASLTHKFFFHIGYNWTDFCYCTPYLGIGGEVEFEGINQDSSEPNRNAQSLIGIWLKGGVAF